MRHDHAARVGSADTNVLTASTSGNSAAGNRARMQTTDPGETENKMKEYREIASDRDRCREFLLRSSMISGLREAERIP